jgi:hypothetical protein
LRSSPPPLVLSDRWSIQALDSLRGLYGQPASSAHIRVYSAGLIRGLRGFCVQALQEPERNFIMGAGVLRSLKGGGGPSFRHFLRGASFSCSWRQRSRLPAAPGPCFSSSSGSSEDLASNRALGDPLFPRAVWSPAGRTLAGTVWPIAGAILLAPRDV